MDLLAEPVPLGDAIVLSEAPRGGQTGGQGRNVLARSSRWGDDARDLTVGAARPGISSPGGKPGMSGSGGAGPSSSSGATKLGLPYLQDRVLL